MGNIIFVAFFRYKFYEKMLPILKLDTNSGFHKLSLKSSHRYLCKARGEVEGCIEVLKVNWFNSNATGCKHQWRLYSPILSSAWKQKLICSEFSCSYCNVIVTFCTCGRKKTPYLGWKFRCILTKYKIIVPNDFKISPRI
jgi:hypothetical protein